jgi:hypothetical protein
MAATVAGALKALIEGAGLKLAAYRDTAPPTAALPFAVIIEGIGRSDAQHGDFGSASARPAVREQAQIDLWQQARDPASGERTEDYGLPDGLFRALHGRRLSGLDPVSSPVIVRTSRRLGASEPNEAKPGSNLVRDIFTVEVIREIPA